MALSGSGLVAPSPPRPGQDEIRQLIFRPYKSGEQPAFLPGPDRFRYGSIWILRGLVSSGDRGSSPLFYLPGSYTSLGCLVTDRYVKSYGPAARQGDGVLWPGPDRPAPRPRNHLILVQSATCPSAGPPRLAFLLDASPPGPSHPAPVPPSTVPQPSRRKTKHSWGECRLR